MATALGDARARRKGQGRGAAPSVREVCLLGSSRPSPAWSAGDRLRWSGRIYRILAAQGEGPGTRHYVHLSSEGDGEG